MLRWTLGGGEVPGAQALRPRGPQACQLRGDVALAEGVVACLCATRCHTHCRRPRRLVPTGDGAGHSGASW